jgi:hypothetical protein
MPVPTIESSPNQAREAGDDTVTLNQVSGDHVEAPVATTRFASKERKASGGGENCSKLKGFHVPSFEAAALAS